jgi:hypothetical protein
MGALRGLLIAGLLALAAAGAPAAAMEQDGRVGRVGWALGAGYAGTAMGDVDQGRADAITGGPELAMALRWRALRRLAFSLDGGYVMPLVRDEPGQFTYLDPFSGQPAQWGYAVRERYDALEALAQAWLVQPWGPLDLRLGGGAGWAWLAGASISSTAPGSQAILLSGDGPDRRAGVGVDAWVDRHFCVSLDAGWRWCRLSPVQCSGGASGRLTLPDGSDLSVDLGGPSARLSGAFWF